MFTPYCACGDSASVARTAHLMRQASAFTVPLADSVTCRPYVSVTTMPSRLLGMYSTA